MKDIRPLIDEHDSFLTEPCSEFDFNNTSINSEEIKKVLFDNMEYYRGIGLSSNQIGLPYKVFSMVHEGNNLLMINPKITEISDNYQIEEEGCLTYPGLYIKIKRPRTVSISYYNENKESFYGLFTDLSCRIILHEMDHMNGKIFYQDKT